MFEEKVTWEDGSPATSVNPANALALAQTNMQYGHTINKDLTLPAIGLGTWTMQNTNETAQIISCAIESGYRLIDTAGMYANEKSVGLGLQMSGLEREELFVTSKVRNEMRGYQRTMDAFFKSLNDLNIDYLDLYLIHWPANEKYYENWDEINRSTWKALVELYQEGYVRAIGVSNFKPHHLRSLMESAVPPMVNQIEFHPGFTQQTVLDYCNRCGIVVEGWSPFGRGKVLSNSVITAIAQKHGKSVAQICLRYALQYNVLPLPKTIKPSRMVENLSVFDFALDEEDMRALDKLNEIKLGYSHEDPDEVE